ncbi:hypothetical protein K0M31_005486 [Melipona bicolor]|uniref:Uncharacterized protein n=1 Tax=Melipona bicolor TaxID=60889 RepID=A0AA40FVQ2_9HYME|nr:hypothetical protein K0M31_005486 [Melipona bicolor]
MRTQIVSQSRQNKRFVISVRNEKTRKREKCRLEYQLREKRGIKHAFLSRSSLEYSEFDPPLSLFLSLSLSIPRAPPGLPTPETFTPFSLHRARSVPGFRATIYQRPPRGSLPMNSYLKRACRGRSLAAQQTGNTRGCNMVLRKLFLPGDDGM